MSTLENWLPSPRPNQERLVPEVVQTSHMDCGPAALKAMLGGFGIAASYGRLREACQTTVDGTSIDIVEQVAQQLGLEAQQIMLPADFLFVSAADALPAIVVVQLPNGMTHFVVIWSVHGPFVQVMNPATGRRLLRREALLEELYIHTHPIPAASWREWAGGVGFVPPLLSRLQELGIDEEQTAVFIETALADNGWLGIATLDAAIRLTDSLARANAIDKGAEAANLIVQLRDKVLANPAEALRHIPDPYWYVRPNPSNPDELLMRGVVLVVVDGVREEETSVADLAPELAAALVEEEKRPFWEIWQLLREDGFLAPIIVAFAAIVAGVGVTLEALILQGILQAGSQLIEPTQRSNMLMLAFAFGGFMLLIEYILADSLARMGRHLDMRLRIAFLSKIPRLSDRYFQSRLISDMTLRAHELAEVKRFPALAVQLLRLLVQMLLTTVGVLYFMPNMVLPILFVVVLALLPSLLARPLLQEQDMRYRAHSSGLSRFYLDGLLGLIPLRTHSAEKSFQNAHEMLLTDWFQAGRNLFNAGLFVRGIQTLLSTGSVIYILVRFIQQGGSETSILLLFYWTLSLPAIGQSVANLILQYPQLRNRVLRILEPLGAPDENEAPATADAANPLPLVSAPAAITMENVNVVAGGHPILRDINLTIQAGEQVAIVGASGAGKSSLVGLLLGWHKAANGRLLLDDQLLTGNRLEALRRQTVWVDPAVHLWNRSLLTNLEYGNTGDLLMSDALTQANLYDVLQQLPNGLQTALGEGGGLVSGGEGQRVRLGRGLLRSDVRLVILDEPFRGLDRPQRQELLAKVRQHWQQATILFISHDVGDTQDFDRVLVVDNGRIAEDASPTDLSNQADSTYRTLLDAEVQVRQQLWQSTTWRRLWLEDGELVERA